MRNRKKIKAKKLMDSKNRMAKFQLKLKLLIRLIRFKITTYKKKLAKRTLSIITNNRRK